MLIAVGMSDCLNVCARASGFFYSSGLMGGVRMSYGGDVKGQTLGPTLSLPLSVSLLGQGSQDH